MATKGTEVAVKDENTALADASLYEQYAGSGFENQTADDYAIPFLQILQALSPQLEGNDNLKVGMIINTVTGEVFGGKDGISFVPATTQHVFVEWKPRDQGGGFVAVHQPDSDLVRHVASTQEFGNYHTPEGNDLIETFYVYGVQVLEDGSGMEAVLAFSSTKIKKYKGWMTKAKTIQIQLPDGRRFPAPLFAHRYRLKTLNEKNKHGSFSNWDVVGFDGASALECRLPPSDPIFQQAVAVKDMIESGKARAAYESQTPGGDDQTGADASKPKF